jgi:hypothetical protein
MAAPGCPLHSTVVSAFLEFRVQLDVIIKQSSITLSNHTINPYEFIPFFLQLNVCVSYLTSTSPVSENIYCLLGFTILITHSAATLKLSFE